MLRAIIGLIPQHRYFQYNVVPRINGTNHIQTGRGGSIEPFDLLDFDAYDEFLQTFAKTGVPQLLIINKLDDFTIP